MAQSILLTIIGFLLPTQLGLHFWPEFSRVAGIKIDYNSPTIYLTDLFLLLYILCSGRKLFAIINKHKTETLLILGLITINTAVSLNPPNTLFWHLRNLHYLLFALVLFKTQNKHRLVKPLLISTLLVFIIQVLQTFTQHSLGGLIYFLGERSYTSHTPNMATISLLGNSFVRAPSIFSHPNSLAGYAVIIFFYLFKNKNKKLHLFAIIPFCIILLTLSKTSLITTLLIILFHSPFPYLLYTVLFTLISPFLLSFSDELSFTSRYSLLQPLSHLNSLQTFLGLGLGSYIEFQSSFLPGSHLTPQNLQPVHNLFMLLFSEIGFLGILLIIYLAIKNKNFIYKPKYLTYFATVLSLGVFDHFLLTLPQNKLIFVVILSLL